MFWVVALLALLGSPLAVSGTLSCSCSPSSKTDPNNDGTYLYDVQYGYDYTYYYSPPSWIGVFKQADPNVMVCLRCNKYALSDETCNGFATISDVQGQGVMEGHLKQGETYYCVVFADTFCNNKLSSIPFTCDGPTQGPHSIVPSPPPAIRRSSSLGLIVGLSVMALVITLIFCVGLFILYKRRQLQQQQNSINYSHIPMESMDAGNQPAVSGVTGGFFDPQLLQPPSIDDPSVGTLPTLTPVYVATNVSY